MSDSLSDREQETVEWARFMIGKAQEMIDLLEDRRPKNYAHDIKLREAMQGVIRGYQSVLDELLGKEAPTRSS